MMNTRLMGQIDIVSILNNVDINASATGDYVSLKNWKGCLIVVLKAAGTAGDDMSLQTFQAQDVAATGEKELKLDRIWHKVGLQTGIGLFTQVVLTTASGDIDTVSVNSVDLLADDVAAMFVMDIPTETLDVSNGFDCLTFKNDGADIGNATQATVIAILYGARQAGNVALSSIVD